MARSPTSATNQSNIPVRPYLSLAQERKYGHLFRFLEAPLAPQGGSELKKQKEIVKNLELQFCDGTSKSRGVSFFSNRFPSNLNKSISSGNGNSALLFVFTQIWHQEN